MNNHHDSLNDFFLHLEKTYQHPKTRRDRLRFVKEYLAWLETKHLARGEVSYNELLNFTGHLQEQGKAAYQRNQYLRAIEDYYAFKKINFSSNAMRIRTPHKTLKPLLESKDLEAIYENYEPKNEIDQILLSLVIWQALEYEDIARIELQDVQLTKGQLYIKSRKGRNARYLSLAPHQIMQLHNYMANTKAKRKDENKLIVPLTETKGSLYMSWRTLSRDVKQQAKEKLNQRVNNLQHLRQSRLAIWVQEEGLRQAQYKSGYTTVKGVERYRSQSIKNLQEQLEKFHPLR
jgi:integrase/recombinase XerD